jgi:sorbitol/mannitol transport system permease protein
VNYSTTASPASGGDYGQPGTASAAGVTSAAQPVASTIAHTPATPATTPGVRAKKRRKPKAKVSLADNLLGVVAWIVALLLFFPIFWMAITAFKSEGQAYSTLLLFTPTLESFSEVFARSNYFAFAWNSILISLGVTVICLIIAVPAAYAMAFFPTKKTQQILLWMLSTKMMPSVGVLIPIYVLWKNAGLLDTVSGLVIVYTLMNLPIAVWMAYTYFCEIPRDILEAGRIDGALTWQEIVFLLLPMSLPGIASTALLLVIMSWNEAFWSINLSSSHAAPLTVFIASYSSPEGLFWAKLSAASLLAVAPILIVGWVSQKQLVRGLTFGAVK